MQNARRGDQRAELRDLLLQARDLALELPLPPGRALPGLAHLARGWAVDRAPWTSCALGTSYYFEMYLLHDGRFKSFQANEMHAQSGAHRLPGSELFHVGIRQDHAASLRDQLLDELAELARAAVGFEWKYRVRSRTMLQAFQSSEVARNGCFSNSKEPL